MHTAPAFRWGPLDLGGIEGISEAATNEGCLASKTPFSEPEAAAALRGKFWCAPQSLQQTPDQAPIPHKRGRKVTLGFIVSHGDRKPFCFGSNVTERASIY